MTDLSEATVTIPAKTYTGETLRPNISVVLDGKELVRNTDYTVNDDSATNAGDYKITITGIGNYTGSIAKTFLIKKAKQTISVTPSSVVKGKTTNLSVKGSFGKLTYSTSNKRVATVSTKGVVKGVTAGTTTVTIKATGDKNHEAVTKKVKFTVYTYATPKIGKVQNANGGVKVTWSKVSGAAKYRVFYKNTKGKWVKLGDTTKTSYAWKKAKSGTKYTFTVRCISKDGKSYTSDYRKKGKTLTYIAAPVLSKVQNTKNGVKVRWKKSVGAVKYRVYYKIGTGRWKKLTDTTSTSYTWKKAKSGTKYTFTVRCISKNGKSYTSSYNAAGKSLTYVATPTLSSVKNSKAKTMTASWKKLSGVTGFQIQYSTDKNFKSGNNAVTVKKASAVSQTINKLSKGKTYYVRIRSYKTVSGKNVYSAWSATKNVKVIK